MWRALFDCPLPRSCCCRLGVCVTLLKSERCCRLRNEIRRQTLPLVVPEMRELEKRRRDNMQTTIEAIPLETNEAGPAVSGEGKYTMSQELSSGKETQEAVPADLSQRHDQEPINMQGWKKQCFLLMLCCPNLLFRRQLLH